MENEIVTFNTSALIVEIAGIAGRVDMIAKILMEGKPTEEKNTLIDFSNKVRIETLLRIVTPDPNNETNETIEDLKAQSAVIKQRLDSYDAAKKEKEEKP